MPSCSFAKLLNGFEMTCLAIPEVAEVSFLAARDYQIDIEISEDNLRSHGMTLTEAADAIRRENQEMPAGTIRSQSQEVSVARQQSAEHRGRLSGTTVGF